MVRPLKRIRSLGRRLGNRDVMSATFFDVAVLRCLFCAQWEEEGVFWSLKYLDNRLKEVCLNAQWVIVYYILQSDFG